MLKLKRPVRDVMSPTSLSTSHFRRDGKGCEWPEPQQSVGDKMQFDELKKKYTCWTAKGPARQLFDEKLGPSIAKICLHYCDLGQQLSFITFCMIGKKPETAAPVIIFSCKDENTRKSLRDFVKRSLIMASDEYRSVRLGDSCYPPGHKSMLLAGDETPPYEDTISDDPSQPASDDIVVHTNSTTSFGSQLVIGRRTGTFDSMRKATAGPIIVRNGKCFCITVAHVFDDRVQAIEEEEIDEISSQYNFSFDGMSDSNSEKDEEHQEWLSRRDKLSFAAGPAHSENMTTSAESPFLLKRGENFVFGSDFDADMSSLIDLQFQTSSPNRQNEPYLNFEIDRSIRETQLHIFGTLTPRTSNVNLDYALIQTAEEPTPFANKVAHLTIANIAQIGPNMVEICTVTASSGIIYGILRPEISYIRLPYSDGIQKVYTVYLNGNVTQGDCGSGIINAKTGDFLGHIIAGTPDSGVALIVPATDVFRDLQSRLGGEIALFMGSDGQRTSPDTSMRTGDIENEARKIAITALQSSAALYETIRDFQSRPKRVRDLLGELEDLIDLLVPLTQVLEIIPMQDYDIELPLIRSSSICLEFQQDLIDCYLDSGDDRMSFQSWAIFRSMNNDIDSLRRLLAGYRLTIEVALANATIRDSASDADDFEPHIDFIETAKSDLEANLEDIKAKLALKHDEKTAGAADSTLRQMEEEQSGLEKCIQICARSENIEEYQLCLGRRRERRRQDVGFLSRISALQLSRGATGATVLGAVDDDLLSRDLLLSVTTKRKGRAPLLWAVERGYMTIVRPLLEQGLDAEVNDQNGHTALQLAARGGHISIFKLLLEKGASVQ